MMHARQQIRNAFATALLNNTDAGANVFNGRVYVLNDVLLPGILVAAREEEIDNEAGEKTSQNRSVSVLVQIQAKEADGVDNVLDALAEEIETLIFADPGINALGQCLDLTTTEMENNSEAEVEVGISTLTFLVKYITENGKPGVII